MLQLSRGHECVGILVSRIEGLNKKSDPLDMPAGKFNDGFSSSLCKELEIEDKAFMVSSEMLQQDKNLSQKRRLVNGDLLLQWGHRKRPRFVKGSTENSANNTATKIKGSRILSMRWQTAEERTDQALQVCGASERINGMAKGSINLARGRNDTTETRTKIALTVVEDGQTCPQDKLSTDNSNGGRTTISHGTTENKPLDDSPAVVGKVISGLWRWPKISVSLSRKEKEEDFLAMKGSKLPQRPKRRSKQAEKALQYVSPGAWLPHLTRDRYEVRERKPIKKRPRGLKEMDSMGSDSE